MIVVQMVLMFLMGLCVGALITLATSTKSVMKAWKETIDLLNDANVEWGKTIKLSEELIERLKKYEGEEITAPEGLP